MALILARAVLPASKLATIDWWSDTTLGPDLAVSGIHTDEVYPAMDWLLTRQDDIEKQLAKKHLSPAVNPSRIAMFDLSSSWVTGRHCELAARGYSRDGKKGYEQIEYGLLTDPDGRPVAIRVFAGNTADPTAFTAAVTAVKDTFALTNMVMVGDRGMITAARIAALAELGGIGWLTALRAPQIAALAADDGPLQMSLFDTVNFAEISHPDYPGERLIACRNPALAAERARKRNALLAATEKTLASILASVHAGRLCGADKIGLRVGAVLGKYKMTKHFQLAITNTSLTIGSNQTSIDTETALDGIYLLRTTIAADELATRRRHRRLHKPLPRRTRLPVPQNHRPGPTPHPPPPQRPGPRTRADLLPRRLPHLAPAPLRRAADVHRRKPNHPNRSRSTRHQITRRAPQSHPQNHPKRPHRTLLPEPARTPIHPDPQRHPLRHRRTHRGDPEYPHRHPTPRLRPPRSPDPTHPHLRPPSTEHPPRKHPNPQVNRLFDVSRAISMESGLRPAVCGCSGIVSGGRSCACF